MDTWARIVALREELIDQLVGLPPGHWDAATLCPGWRVRDVVAHTILPERFVTFSGLLHMARMGFDLRRMVHTDAIRRGSVPVDELVAAYRSGVRLRTVPPGRTLEHVLDDLFIHAQDIRRPLDLPWQYEPELLTGVLAQVAADRKLGFPANIVGLRLIATDVDWSCEPGGASGGTAVHPEVTGPAEALVLAMSGRSAALADLSGAGVRVLASRIA